MKNEDRTIRRLGQISIEARKGLGAALARSVVKLDAYAKVKIQGGGRSGRVYRRRSVTHQASAPGEFPKTDTGQLVGSLFFLVNPSRLSAVFGTDLLHGKLLELGTSRMLARPWLRPTYKANEQEVSSDVARAVREALRKAVTFG